MRTLTGESVEASVSLDLFRMLPLVLCSRAARATPQAAHSEGESETCTIRSHFGASTSNHVCSSKNTTLDHHRRVVFRPLSTFCCSDTSAIVEEAAEDEASLPLLKCRRVPVAARLR